MKMDNYFPILEPPSGGIDRLRRRLDERAIGRPLVPALSLAFVLAMLAVPWILDYAGTDGRVSVQVDDMRRILAEHRAPGLSIDGEKPEELHLGTDTIEVYFVNGSR